MKFGSNLVKVEWPFLTAMFVQGLLCSMRQIGPEGFGKKEREWNETVLLEDWRKSWENHCNSALEQAGFDERVDCRSLADQGIDREPQPKIGVVATAMERRGLETRRGIVAGWHAFRERIRSAVKGIETVGEVPQTTDEVPHYGVGSSWWERAQAAFDYSVTTAREFLRSESSGRWQPQETPTQELTGGWESYERSRQQPQQNIEGDERERSMGFG
jgi:hypothetical protein